MAPPLVTYEKSPVTHLWVPREGGSDPGTVINLPSRDNLIPGEFFPDATNTGHITAKASLNVVNGNQSWNAEHDNTVWTGQRYTGRMQFNCQNVTFYDCLFEGALPNDTASFCAWPSGLRCQNIRFIDCSFIPKFTDHGTHCIMGHHFTATRCNFQGGVDATGVNVVPKNIGMRADVVFEGCWMHDMGYFSPDSFHAAATDNQTHNDACQWGSGYGVTFLGCRIEGFVDPAIGNASDTSVDSGSTHISGNAQYPRLNVASGLIPVKAAPKTDYGPPGELTFRKNWVSGGSVGLNITAAYADGGFTTNDGSIIEENFFGWDWQSGDDFVIFLHPNQLMTIQNNYRWGGAHARWVHGDASTGLTHNEDTIDPWDKSVPFTVVKRF
jgi:hypothetical protein